MYLNINTFTCNLKDNYRHLPIRKKNFNFFPGFRDMFTRSSVGFFRGKNWTIFLFNDYMMIKRAKSIDNKNSFRLAPADFDY